MSGTNAPCASFQHAMEQVRQRIPSVTMLVIEHALRDVSVYSNMQEITEKALLMVYSNILVHHILFDMHIMQLLKYMLLPCIKLCSSGVLWMVCQN